MARPRKLEFALARIAHITDTRKQALKIARQEVERDTIDQMATGVFFATPADARAWYWLRLDGATVPLEGPARLLCLRCGWHNSEVCADMCRHMKVV